MVIAWNSLICLSLSLSLFLCLSLSLYITHFISFFSLLSLYLSIYLSIVHHPGRFSILHPVSAQSWCMQDSAGRSIVVSSYVEVYKKTLSTGLNDPIEKARIEMVLENISNQRPKDCKDMNNFFNPSSIILKDKVSNSMKITWNQEKYKNWLNCKKT